MSAEQAAAGAQALPDRTVQNPAQDKKPKGGKKKKIEGAAMIGIDIAKEDDFSGWYQQVLLKGDMLDYYDVSGCFVLKVCLPASLISR